MIRKPFIDQFPRPLPRDAESLFYQWTQAHQDSFDEYDTQLGEVAISHRITDAEGLDLDRIGEQFGRIGERRGRGDSEYRSFLLSIVPSFRGRGTVSGLKFAIGSGVRAREDEIYIEEFFDANEYAVEVGDWIAHKVTTVEELADLADPSGVGLRTPIKYRYERADLSFEVGNTQRIQAITSPPIELSFQLSDTTASYRSGGFGTGRFDGKDPFGEPGSPVETDSDAPLGGASFGGASFGGGGDDGDGNDADT